MLIATRYFCSAYEILRCAQDDMGEIRMTLEADSSLLA
jgi:hypothetical protein